MATWSRVPSIPSLLDAVPYRLTALALFALVTVADLVSGYEFNFFLFYLVPIMLAAWHGRTVWVVMLATLSSVFWMAADAYVWHVSSSFAYLFWNGAMRLCAFLLVGLLMSLTRRLLRQQEVVNAQLSQTLQEVRQLKGLLPVCAACKRIRNDRGYWEEIEAYISDHSDAIFTHGICPTCAQHLYPDLCEEAHDPHAPALGLPDNDVPPVIPAPQ